MRSPYLHLAVAVTAAIAGLPAPVHAQAAPDRAAALGALWERAAQALEQASDELEPPLAPPSPVAVRWQARRISSIGLGAPLLAMAAADLDGDRRAELIMLTATEVVIVERRGHRELAVRASAALPAEPASLRPRDPVGTLVLADTDGDGRPEIIARSSEQERGAVLAYQGGALIERARVPGFPLCPGVRAELEPGRNFFVALTADDAGAPPAWLGRAPERSFAILCRSDLVDAAGRGLAVAALVATDHTLHVHGERRCPRRDHACRQEPAATFTLADAGVAVAVADVNRDGHIDAVVTAATPPGAPDQIAVVTWRDGQARRLYTRAMSSGVAAVAAGDLDGDGVDDVVAAVRVPGTDRVDLWMLTP